MAEIDVTDVLYDADVAGDAFTVVRRQEVVDQYGVSQVYYSQAQAVGAVQPGGDNALMRDSDYDAQQRGIKIYTTFRLYGASTVASAGYKPDQVLWRGSTFEVRTLEDYTQFGGGMVEAECVEVTYVGPPPDQLPPYVGSLDFSSGANSGEGGGAAGCA